MPDVYQVTQGSAANIDVVLRNSAGAVITTYAGTEPLSASIWTGGNVAAEFAPAATWTSAAAGTVAIAITAAQTATLTPGRYEGMLRLDDSGNVVDAYPFVLDVEPFAGGIVAATRPMLLTIEEAAANIPGFDASAPGEIDLIENATNAINRRAARIFPLATHDETHEPTSTRTIRLKQYPVRSIERLCAGLTTAVSVVNTTLVRPYISLTPSTTMDDPGAAVASVVLGGYASGTATTTTLSLATYTTLATLVAAINAVSEWTATLQDATFADLPSSDLVGDFGRRDAGTSAELRIYSREIQHYDVNYRTGVITIRETLPTNFRFPDRTWGAARGGTVRCMYTAGYDSTTMPGDLKRACCILVKGMAQKSAVGLQTQQKSGDQFAIINQGLMASVEDLIAPHCRRSIF